MTEMKRELFDLLNSETAGVLLTVDQPLEDALPRIVELIRTLYKKADTEHFEIRRKEDEISCLEEQLEELQCKLDRYEALQDEINNVRNAMISMLDVLVKKF